MKVLPHGASCRVRRRYRQALPQHFCARAWWSLCGSWHRRGRRGGTPTEKMQREKTHQPSTASTSSISDPSELIPALLRFSSPLASLISLSFYLLSLVQRITQPPFTSPLAFQLLLHCLSAASCLPVLHGHLSCPGAPHVVPETSPEQSPRSPAGLTWQLRDPLHMHTPMLRCLYLRPSCPCRLPSPSPSKPHGIFLRGCYQCHECYILLYSPCWLCVKLLM